MESKRRYDYHQLAKQLGVPNIILTGIEKKVKIEFPDDDEMYACHVLRKLQAMADDPTSDWSNCGLEESGIPSGTGDFLRK